MIKSLPKQDRPRERLIQFGAEKLATTELLAVILGNGTKGKSVLHLAQELLSHFGSLSRLLETPIEELCTLKGLGLAQSVKLKAALSLGLRIYQETTELKSKLETPQQAYDWVKEYLVREKKEVFGIILRDVRGNALRWELVSIGILTQTIVHPREVFYPAIRHLAASIILVHNHPSGDPTPSPHDLEITRRLVSVSYTVGIPISDHLIVTSKTFISLKESGFNFTNN